MEVKAHVRGKLQRWAMSLTDIPYTIHHIAGDDNLWADLLSRWGLGSANGVGVATKAAPVMVKAVTRATTRSLRRPTLLRPRSGDFEFPSEDEIRLSQTKYHDQRPPGTNTGANDVLTVDNRVWIPHEDTDLLLRIMIVAHCGAQGHRGLDPMVHTIREVFEIKNIEQRCKQFLARCLLCKHMMGGNTIPRPWGPTHTATSRNKVLHMDFLSMREANDGSRYVLALKDGLTHFCELVACDSASQEVTVQAMVDWSKRFGAPKMISSDQGSHFKNAVIQDFCKRVGIEQRMSVVYSPWLNGSVERLNRDILQVTRVMLMEASLDTREWPHVLSVVQSNLNHSPMRSLEGHAPTMMFTGLEHMNPLLDILGDDGHAIDDRPLRNPTEDLAGKLERLQSSLADIHRSIAHGKDKRRTKQATTHKGEPCNFTIGDFVLWSRVDERLPNNKLLVRWIGPFVVTDTVEHAFHIQHLVTKKQYIVHASRLKFYHDARLNVTDELLAHVANQGMVLGVSAIVDHRYSQDRGEWQLLVAWVGLQEENSWEPIGALLKDVPQAVRKYCAEHECPALTQWLQKHYAQGFDRA